MHWKILSISAPDGELITEAKYFVTYASEGQKVETEGHWYFQEPQLNKPLSQVSEEMVVAWIREQTMRDGKNMIEARLQEQMDNLKKQRKTALPWLPQVFTPEV